VIANCQKNFREFERTFQGCDRFRCFECFYQHKFIFNLKFSEVNQTDVFQTDHHHSMADFSNLICFD